MIIDRIENQAEEHKTTETHSEKILIIITDAKRRQKGPALKTTNLGEERGSLWNTNRRAKRQVKKKPSDGLKTQRPM